MSRKGLKRLVIILISILFVGCGNNPTWINEHEVNYEQQIAISKIDIISAFNRFDASLNNGAGYCYYDNLNGSLAWGESYIMASYLAMYRGTGDIEYLRKFIWHAENVLSRRDDKIGYYDYRGISGPTWLSTVFTNGYKYAFVVHSGMITYPLADFAQMIKRDSTFWRYKSYSNKAFIDVADEFMQRVSETIEAHNSQWDDNVGAYRFNNDALFYEHHGKILPFNQQNAMGRTLLLMYMATNKDIYLYKTIKLAKYFRNQLALIGNNSYIWTYWTPNSNIEDISHGAIDVDFAYLCYENGIMFNNTDMEHFVSTFKNNIYKAPFVLSERVDGTGEDNKYLYQSGRWLEISRFDRDIYKIISDIFSDKILHQSTESDASIFLGVANIVYYYDH